MELLEDPVIKTKYLKCKLRVKSWESDFIEKYGRRPSKNDIKEAHALIKDSYKIYWNLKTKVLEQTLTDITFSDEPEINDPPIETREDSSIVDNVRKNMENIDPCSNTQNVDTTIPPKKNTLDGPNVDGAWGDHLNSEQCSSTKRKTLLIGRSSSSFQLSQNKFTSDNFVKRNPRKCLSLNKIKSKSDLNDSTCVKNLSQDKTDLDQSRDGFDIDEDPKSVFDKSNLKIISDESKSIVQPLHTIQQLIQGQSSGMKRNINLGWLERCSNMNPSPEVCHNSESLSGKSDSGRESMESNSCSPPDNVPIVVANSGFHSSDEDFIYDSDDSEKHSRKRSRDYKTDAPPAKRLCIDDSSRIENPTNNVELENVQDKHYGLIPNENKDVIVEAEEPIIRPKKSRKSNQAHLYNEHLDSDSYSEHNSDLDSDYNGKRGKSKPRLLRKTKKRLQKKRVATERSCESNDEEPEPDIPIYGVETIETVPRFSISKMASGDLIADFSKSINIPESSIRNTTTKTKEKLTDKEKLEERVKSGKLNENFVRINLKKKIYVRGKKTFNFSKYKKNQWKERKKELESSENNLYAADMMDKSGGIKCFKCGNIGHFARSCTTIVNEELLKLDDIDDSEESRYPTLEEAERMAKESTMKMNDNFPGESALRGHEVPKDIVAKLLPLRMKSIDPVYTDPHPTETPSEVFEALKMFGHENFRPGQEKAILRILSGQSTLVTLSTGSGKSLCYQLPAYLYSKRSNCITLVISPLVSLMNDQVTGVPSFITAATLHTNQTPKVQENVMQMIKEGTLNILLLSPEAVVAGEKSTGFGALLRQLPPIAFACIDEAHCISQWSHNFRPSYLMLSRVLKEKLGVGTILGLTATAKKSTAESIVKHLAIPDGLSGVISDTPIPDNLFLTVSKDENKDCALIKLLNSERFLHCNSIIVYCIRREECVRVAGVLRTSLQNTNDSKSTNGKVSSIAEAYHAGLSAYRRKIVQNSFMKGSTKIVVATVAFGMGINKPDIRSVIHYNMPGCFEGYVQEVGRAGRDGLRAQCHLFLNSKENSDKWELRRHIFANGVDRYTIRRLLEKVFIPCSCKTTMEENTTERCPGHEVAIPIDETVNELDVSEETITTLLCYLELHPKRFITVLSSVYVRAKVSSYKGSQTLKLAAQSSPPLAMAIALDLKKGISHENDTVVEFPVVDIASAIGWDSGVVKSHLKSLEWKKVNGKSKRSAISVHYDTLGLRIRAPGDLTEAELDEALDELVACTQSQEMSSLQQLEIISEALNRSSTVNIKGCLTIDENVTKKSELLKDTIRTYFTSDHQIGDIEVKTKSNPENEKRIAADIRSMISIYKDNNLTGRAIARIFHGIQSPNYPAVMWSKCRYWRSHLDTDFNTICQLGTKEILGLH